MYPVSIILFFKWEKIALLSTKLLMTAFLKKVLLLGAVKWLYLPTEVLEAYKALLTPFCISLTNCD